MNSVSISPRYSNFWKAPRYASHNGVRLPRVKLRSLHHTAESSDHIFHKTPQCASLCGVISFSEKQSRKTFKTMQTWKTDIFESVWLPAVSILPRSQTLRCASHRGDERRSVHLTSESSSLVCNVHHTAESDWFKNDSFSCLHNFYVFLLNFFYKLVR